MLPEGERHLQEEAKRKPTIWTGFCFRLSLEFCLCDSASRSCANEHIQPRARRAPALSPAGSGCRVSRPPPCWGGRGGKGDREGGPRLSRTARTRMSRSLNHHGQLTGFPQPAPRCSQTPQEPPARLIFMPWRHAMFHGLHPPRSPTATTEQLYIDRAGFEN